MATSTLDELIASCGYPGVPDEHPLAFERISPFLAQMNRVEFCNAFSRRVAQEYAAGRISFEIADDAMNRLWEYAGIGEENFIPSFAERVFEAFDAGEYWHSEDAPGTDPELKYTRPWIEELLANEERT